MLLGSDYAGECWYPVAQHCLAVVLVSVSAKACCRFSLLTPDHYMVGGCCSTFGFLGCVALLVNTNAVALIALALNCRVYPRKSSSAGCWHLSAARVVRWWMLVVWQWSNDVLPDADAACRFDAVLLSLWLGYQFGSGASAECAVPARRLTASEAHSKAKTKPVHGKTLDQQPQLISDHDDACIQHQHNQQFHLPPKRHHRGKTEGVQASRASTSIHGRSTEHERQQNAPAPRPAAPSSAKPMQFAT
ncbi:hypothetical protein Nepgr_027273 [Nepenthes gracilis]|uniref:Uncharacterized protein n=1 Tax=Nepenthes gracilis TaxID=150966 RepID=A0AAD3T8B2_NEPGR|nr:hypothetical protein Nepgr_027273 [Nepenthes gracilis]